MKSHDILGINPSATIKEIELGYRRAKECIAATQPEDESERMLLKRKKEEVELARVECLEYASLPPMARIKKGISKEITSSSKLHSWTCVPPGLGWCGAKIIDEICGGCCGNKEADCYGESKYTYGMPTDDCENPCRIADLVGWVICLFCACTILRPICSDASEHASERRIAKQAAKEAAEEEKRKREQIERQKRLDEERKVKAIEKQRVESVLSKANHLYKSIETRENDVNKALSIIITITNDVEIEKIQKAYGQEAEKEKAVIREIVKKITEKKSFQDNKAEFENKYRALLNI